MKINHIVLSCALVVLVFAGIIFLFFYENSAPNSNSHFNSNETPLQNRTPQQPTTTTPVSGQQPVATDTHTALDDCILLKTDQAKGQQYEKGSLIVTFLPALDYATAIESTHLLGLQADTSQTGKDTYSQYHWLTVIVPKGEEFKWQCVLESSEGIKAAHLNITFNLHQ